MIVYFDYIQWIYNGCIPYWLIDMIKTGFIQYNKTVGKGCRDVYAKVYDFFIIQLNRLFQFFVHTLRHGFNN